MVKPAITMLTIDISLMRILSDGPEVSLNGSPTVSPTIVALWFSLPFAAEVALLYHLLGIVPCTSRIGHEHGKRKAGCQTAGEKTENAGHTQHQDPQR